MGSGPTRKDKSRKDAKDASRKSRHANTRLRRALMMCIVSIVPLPVPAYR